MTLFALHQFKQKKKHHHHDQRPLPQRDHCKMGPPPFPSAVLEPGEPGFTDTPMLQQNVFTHTTVLSSYIIFSSTFPHCTSSIETHNFKEVSSPLLVKSVFSVPTCCSHTPYPPQARSFLSSFHSLRSLVPTILPNIP